MTCLVTTHNSSIIRDGKSGREESGRGRLIGTITDGGRWGSWLGANANVNDRSSSSSSSSSLRTSHYTQCVLSVAPCRSLRGGHSIPHISSLDSLIMRDIIIQGGEEDEAGAGAEGVLVIVSGDAPTTPTNIYKSSFSHYWLDLWQLLSFTGDDLKAFLPRDSC